MVHDGDGEIRIEWCCLTSAWEFVVEVGWEVGLGTVGMATGKIRDRRKAWSR